MDNDGIIRKIEALMRQAESTTFEGERDAFLQKADELILKFQIDQALLFKSEGRNETPVIVNVWTDNPWEPAKGVLLGVVAKHYNCRSIAYGRTAGKRLRKVIGFKSDVDAVLAIWTSLIIQCESAMARDWPTKPSYEHGKTWKVNYWEGFNVRIMLRLEEMRKINTQDMDKSYLPVLLDRKSQVNDFVDDQFGKLRASKAIAHRDSAHGQKAGWQAANKADIGLGRIGQTPRLGG